MIPRKSFEPRKTEPPQGARNVVVLELTQRYQKEICLTFVLYKLSDCSIYFLFGTVFIQFQYFFWTNIDILIKRLSQLKLQFKYQKLFNCCIYAIFISARRF